MTDFATMEAGPEIDALVAEMMGWVRLSFCNGNFLCRPECTDLFCWPGSSWQKGWTEGNTFWPKGSQQLADYPYPLDVPPYSTDPAAEWELLCHVRETWDHPALCRFAEALSDLIMLRECGAESLGHHVNVLGFVSHFQRGDYARAALMAQERAK